MNSVWLRPSSQDKDSYNFLLGGPHIDYDKISTSEGFAKHFYSLTKRTDIIFGDMICVAKYRLERGSVVISFPMLTVFVHLRANIRMVDTLRVGRVFIAGG